MLEKVIVACIACVNLSFFDLSACDFQQSKGAVVFSGTNCLSELQHLTGEMKEIKSVIFKNVSLDKRFNFFFQQKISSKLDLLGFINCDLSAGNSFYDILPDGISLKKLLIINCGLTCEDFRSVLSLLDPYVLETMNVSNNKDIENDLASFRHIVNYYENCWSIKHIKPVYSFASK